MTQDTVIFMIRVKVLKIYRNLYIKKKQSTEVLIFGIIETQINWEHDRCDKKKLSRRDELVEKVIGKKLFTGEKELLEIMKVITEPLSEELR
jgi:hypothetical protein